MKDLINKIINLPLGIKVAEIIYLIFILLYFYIQSGKGLATTFYAFLAVEITGAITSIYLLFFKRNYVLGIINLVIAAAIFIHLASLSY